MYVRKKIISKFRWDCISVCSLVGKSLQQNYHWFYLKTYDVLDHMLKSASPILWGNIFRYAKKID